jgi:AraC-like DNA-binding protein
MVNLLELAHIVDVLDDFAPKPLINRALRQADLSRDMLRAAPGFIPYAPVAVMAEAASRALGERHLGILIGQRFQYSSYDGYAEYVLSAPYLGAALARARRALPLIHPGSDLILRQDAEFFSIGFVGQIDTVTGYRHIAEAALLVISQVFHHFLGPEWHPEWMEVATTSPKAQSLLEDALRSPLRMGTPYSALTIRMADLRTRNPDPALVRQAIPFASLVAKMGGPAPKTLSQSVLQLLQCGAGGTDLTQERAAALLSLGVRSLQRSLQSEGTTFRALKIDFLKSQSQALLMDTPLKIDDVARRLGYAEPNSFRRAFHGWTGLSPRAFRARHSAQI